MRNFLATVLLALAAAPAHADDTVWRWADDAGEAHYTNDASKIPERFRGKATQTRGEELSVVASDAKAPAEARAPAAPDVEIVASGEADQSPKAKTEVRQVLFFTADWCAPCREMKKAKTMERLLQAHPDLKLVEYDAEASEAAARKYAVRVLPTVVFADASGRELLKVRGARDLAGLERALTSARSGAK